MASKRSFADGAPGCTWSAGCLLLVGVALAVATILYAIVAGRSSVEGTNLGLVVTAAILTALLLVCACVGGCRLWLEQPPVNDGSTEPLPRGPLSPWRLACFGVAALAAATVFVLALIALGSLGTSGFGELVAAIIISGLVLLFVGAVAVFFCAERT